MDARVQCWLAGRQACVTHEHQVRSSGGLTRCRSSCLLLGRCRWLLWLPAGIKCARAARPEQRPDLESPGGCIPHKDPGIHTFRQAVAQVLPGWRLVHGPRGPQALCQAHSVHALGGVLLAHASGMDVVRHAVGRTTHGECGSRWHRHHFRPVAIKISSANPLWSFSCLLPAFISSKASTPPCAVHVYHHRASEKDLEHHAAACDLCT